MWGLFFQLQAQLHAFVAGHDRGSDGHRRVVLAQEARHGLGQCQEFVGLEEQGDTLAAAHHPGLQGEESHESRELQAACFRVEHISPRNLAASQCSGEAAIGREAKRATALHDAHFGQVAIDLALHLRGG